MEINVCEKEKRVEIWLTNEEQQDKMLLETLEPIFKQCKASKFLVAVYRSGRGSLLNNTKELLLRNRF